MFSVASRPKAQLAEARGWLAPGAPKALVIEDALEPARAARIVEVLTADAMPRHSFSPAFEAYSLGRILDQAQPDLGDYFAERPRYLDLLTRIGAGSLEHDVRALLQELTSLPIEVPTHPEDGAYGLSTLRYLPERGTIPPHCEREQLSQPTHAHLTTLLAEQRLFSWYLLLRAPEEGGELALHPVLADSDAGRSIYADRMNARDWLPLDAAECVAAPTGALVVFSGDQAFHEILPVKDPGGRWTLGGFLGFGKARVYAFS